jgi:hypothetical protein
MYRSSNGDFQSAVFPLKPKTGSALDMPGFERIVIDIVNALISAPRSTFKTLIKPLDVETGARGIEISNTRSGY